MTLSNAAHIEPTAIVHPNAKIGNGVKIGAYCIVEDDVEIGDGCVLDAHAIVKSKTRLGKNNHIFSSAMLGGPPQHLSYSQETAQPLQIGDGNVFREFATVHLGTKEPTIIGDKNFFMSCSHVGHDCQLGSHNVVASSTVFGGHCEVGSHITFGGASGIHQYCRIGDYAMIAGLCPVSKDVPPYTIVGRSPVAVYRTNSIGLRRGGMSAESIKAISAFYKLFRKKLYKEATPELLAESGIPLTNELLFLLDWLKEPSKRGIYRPLSSSAKSQPGEDSEH